MSMAAITETQIQKARSTSLLDYYKKNEPLAVKQAGKRHVHIKHDSLVIDNGKGQWFWNSKGEGGHSALDFLIKVEGLEFKDAVEKLSGSNLFTKNKNNQVNQTHVETHEKREINLPIKAPDNNGCYTA